MADRFCAVPGCAARLWPRNTTGVCRDHIHRADHCRCTQCRTPGRARYRVATRQEMIDKGLLLRPARGKA